LSFPKTYENALKAKKGFRNAFLSKYWILTFIITMKNAGGKEKFNQVFITVENEERHGIKPCK
jgi:hypothetical protein